MFRTPRLLLASLLVLATACATHPPAGATGDGVRDRSLLTHEELNAIAYPSAYHAVEVLRSNWLRPRGVSSPDPNVPNQVWVMLDNIRLGGVDALRTLSTREIVFIRFYDPASAGARWGRDFAHGAIHVSTERR